jgi:hypothetical protein
MSTGLGSSAVLGIFASGRNGHTAGARTKASLLALALLVGLAAPALAGDDEAAQAAGHARKAEAAIDLGHYAEAAQEYEAAYMRSPDARTLVSVGQAWQLAGERQKALTAFRSCLRVAPTGEQRAHCEARIRELESSGQPAPAPWGPAEVSPIPVPPPPAPRVAQAPEPPPYVWQPEPPPNLLACPPLVAKPAESNLGWPFWTMVGAVVTAGIVLGIVYFNQDTDLTMPNTTFGAKQF